MRYRTRLFTTGEGYRLTSAPATKFYNYSGKSTSKAPEWGFIRRYSTMVIAYKVAGRPI